MKTNARESYGFGPRLSTRQDRASRAARIIGFAIGFGIIAGLLWI